MLVLESVGLPTAAIAILLPIDRILDTVRTTVNVEGDMIEHGLNRLQHGLTYKGKELPSVKASWQNENRLRFALKNPQPGIIALFCQAVGLKAVAIRRIRIGGVSIGKVPLGQWRYLSGKEKF